MSLSSDLQLRLGWDYIVGGPERGLVYLIRLRYLAAVLSP